MMRVKVMARRWLAVVGAAAMVGATAVEAQITVRSDGSGDPTAALRAGRYTEAIEVLTLNQPLTVLNCEPVENGGFVWWNVENEDSGNRGWVVQDWLKAEQ